MRFRRTGTVRIIADHRDEFLVRRMCEGLDVSPSGYYAWRTRPPSTREMANQELLKEIEAVFEDSKETYGSPRVSRKLKRQGAKCSENRIARLMRLRDLKAKQTRCFKSTTKRNRSYPVAPNLLQRNFATKKPNEIWLTDITYISTWEGS